MRRLLILVLLAATSGCAAVRQSMISGASASLAESAAVSFGRESDPVLAAAAMPFALKTLDMLALQNPRDPGIQLSAGRTYIQYSAAFLDWEARKLELTDLAAANALRRRAAALHFRGRDYAAAALDLIHPPGRQRLIEDADAFLAGCGRADVPVLFWLASGWAAGIASDPSNMREIAHIGLIEAIMRRCLELDPEFDDGSLHEFFLVFEATRAAAAGGDTAVADEYFHRALAASGGRRASPYVIMATTVMVHRQDAEGYRDLLNTVLAMNLDAAPDNRLANEIARDKARWYLENIEEFLLLDDSDDEP